MFQNFLACVLLDADGIRIYAARDTAKPYVKITCEDDVERNRLSVSVYTIYKPELLAQNLRLRTKRDPNNKKVIYMWLGTIEQLNNSEEVRSFNS